ncbi:MAG: type VI secretion system tip protein VgrG [Nitrospirae bacterium]|nr:type VI secretion system tip protein VgrG [Nitrospirota bacterium]
MPVIKKSSSGSSAKMQSNLADYTFETGYYTDDYLRVVRFHGKEAISEPFYFEVELASSDHNIDFDSVVGEKGLLTFNTAHGKRYVNGIVTRFEQTGKGIDYNWYRAELRPKFWLLTLKQNVKMFQYVTAVEIIKKVLSNFGISGDQIEFSPTKTYESRIYCVQYRETDFNFVSRLMEEEGIYYYFKHDKDKHTMVLGDDVSVHSALPTQPTLIYNPPTGVMIEKEEHIHEFTFSKKVRTQTIKLRDFNFKKPNVIPESTSSSDSSSKLKVYDYPGKYITKDEGDSIAKIRKEAAQSIEQIGMGKSNVRTLLTGYTITMDRHHRDDFNSEYLITEIKHQGEQTQVLEREPEAGNVQVKVYENYFKCIPSDVQFRPLRVSLIPVIRGTQTAIVTGPSGEEIYTDQYGRIKVQFHWDLEGQSNENSSCWIRVAHGWSGQKTGIIFIPRIGQEVVVSFIEGDPDRPIITGCVYNGEQTVPYTLPADKTKSTIKTKSSLGGGGNNELRFEDKKGSEQVYIHAQKNMDVEVENNKTLTVGKARSGTIGTNDTLSVGNNRNTTVQQDDSLKVNKGGRSIEALVGTYELQAKDIKLTATNSIEIVCSSGSIKIDSTGTIKINSGILVDIKGTMVKINS